MTLNDFFLAIAGISGLLFVVTSMLAMSLSLSLQQMTQPLKNARLVILALLANFVLVPALAYVITKVIPLDESLRLG
jgi:BASS family bile acid:Na+ symporter